MWIAGKKKVLVMLSDTGEVGKFYWKKTGGGTFAEFEELEVRHIEGNVYEVKIAFDEAGSYVVLAVSGTNQSIMSVEVIAPEDVAQDVNFDEVLDAIAKTDGKIDIVNKAVKNVIGEVETAGESIEKMINESVSNMTVSLDSIDIEEGPRVIISESIHNKDTIVQIVAGEGIPLEVRIKSIEADEFTEIDDSLSYIGENIHEVVLVLERGMYVIRVTDLSTSKSTYETIRTIAAPSDGIEKYIVDTNMKVSAVNKRLKMKGI